MRFNARTNGDEILADVDIRGKRVLVTGVSSGLGLELSRLLLEHGADVVGTVRDEEKAMRTAETLATAQQASGARFSAVLLDLGSLAQVTDCADALLGAAKPFDVVIANAGVMATPMGLTVDGFETQFATNHLGHFLLVNRLSSLLVDTARVIVVSSSGHRLADMDLDDPNFATTPYDPMIAYGRSKTANVFFAIEYDRRHRKRGVRAAAVHPGGVQTELARHLPTGALAQMMARLNAQLTAAGRKPHESRSLSQGTATMLWAAFVAPPDQMGGRYCEDCAASKVITSAASPISAGVFGYALDVERAQHLWARSAQWVGQWI